MVSLGVVVDDESRVGQGNAGASDLVILGKVVKFIPFAEHGRVA